MSETATKRLTIGQVAEAAGVGIETIRFYEREGLIPEAPRTPAGYRQYAADTVERLRFIQRAKELGFSLRETQELLTLRLTEAASAADLRLRAAEKVRDITAKIRDLKTMRDSLTVLLSTCPGLGALDGCPILVALTRDEAAR
jgi:MerR family copper efflux transcriptional regulator